MSFFKPIKNQFIIIFILSLILLFIFKNNFWFFLAVPIGNENSFFNDLRMVQQWSRLFEFYDNTEYVYTNRDLARLNYPKVWIIFSKFIEKEFLFCTYLAISSLGYFYILYRFVKQFNTYFFIYFFYSGSSLLALQRGNVEIFIFILISLVLICQNLYIKKFIFLLAVVTKIFPVFAIQYFLLCNKNLFKTIILGLACVIYFYLIKDQLNFIYINSPHTGDGTYGSESVVLNLKKHFNLSFNYIYLSGWFIISSICIYFLFFKKYLSKQQFKYEDYFFIGSGIFIFTFLINSSHDYRLIFLCFCLPLFLNLKIKNFKYLCLLSLIATLELTKLTVLFGFFGGVLNVFFKIILFYIISFITLDILIKNYNKIINGV